ncbi:MAG: KOW motif-containing protein [Armatimonadota bacterium]|nr:KOW motif-containing protein [Armatimonadota bacterium]
MSVTSDGPVQPGDIVHITAGPFAGGKARVQSVDTGKSQVHVQMLVLGEPASFTVKLDQVKLAASTKTHS